MTLEQLSWHVDDVVARELQGLKGVGRVERYGGVDREIRSRSIPIACSRSASPRARSTARSAPPMSISPAGAARSAGRSRIRTLAGARTVAELAETKIMLAGGREVRLKELGRVEDSTPSRAPSAASQAARRRLLGLPLQGLERVSVKEPWPRASSS
jgi:multidrug efflux pump subunit AcrB